MKLNSLIFLCLFLCLLLCLFIVDAQAGYLTKGLESQLQHTNDFEVIKVLVVLKDQVDVKTLNYDLYNSKTKLSTRHEQVVKSLSDKASITQRDLLSTLANKKAAGGILGYTPHWLVNAVVVTGTAEAIRTLAAHKDVERIEVDLVVELIEPIASGKLITADIGNKGIGLTPGVRAVGAPLVWNDLGIDGSGVIVGQIDTGVDGFHPAFAARWQGNFAPAEHCWLDVAGSGNTSFPVDLNDHGTHVMGTMTGLAEGDTIGVAPGAHWIATNAIVPADRDTFDNAVLASLEFMTDPDGNPATMADVPAVVVNCWGISEELGHYVDCDSRWWNAIDNCEAAGVVLVWSAANDGPDAQTIRSPADRATSNTNSFSVGSTENYSPFTISEFSSRGPSGCGGDFEIKPEICGPGSTIYSAAPGAGFQYKDGTSMAAPHVAGVVALMRAANPDVDVLTIKEVLMATATDLGSAGEDNDYGHGMVNAYAAVMQVTGGVGTIAGTISDSNTGLPIADVIVRRVGGNNKTTTDQNGNFQMMMPVGEIGLSFTNFNYNIGSATFLVEEDAVTNTSYVLEPKLRAVISGHVYDSAGESVEGATIRAFSTPVPGVLSDANGYYELSLPCGAGVSYDVRACALGQGYENATIELAESQTHDFNLPDLIYEDFESGDFVTFPWEMNGSHGWVIDSIEDFEGSFCASSGVVDHEQQAELEIKLDVAQTGNIIFWYKVSSELSYDFLRFYVDGVLVCQWSGIQPWSSFTYEIPAGQHMLKWTYEKDIAVAGDTDRAWLDLIEFPTLAPPKYPILEMDSGPIAVCLEHNESSTLSRTINNSGENDLEISLHLYEVTEPAKQISAGPDDFGYTCIDSDSFGGPTYNWIDISESGVVAGGSNNENLGPFDLGFDFDFYGVEYSSVRVCTNGWLSFTSTNIDQVNRSIPTATEPNNLLAVLWDNFALNDGGNIYYKAEDDRFIVQFDEIRHYVASHNGVPETFQVIINKDGSIVYQYKVAERPYSATVGIENSAGDDGLMMAYNSVYIHPNLAIRFSYEPPMTWVQTAQESATVAPGASLPLNLTFDSTGLEKGDYHAQIAVTSNDTLAAVTIIPIKMSVGYVSSVDEDNLLSDVQFSGAEPNPFNPATNIKFSLPDPARVSLKVYDISGRLVRTLLTESLPAGPHQTSWNGQDNRGKSVASGSYFARLLVDGKAIVRPLVLVR